MLTNRISKKIFFIFMIIFFGLLNIQVSSNFDIRESELSFVNKAYALREGDDGQGSGGSSNPPPAGFDSWNQFWCCTRVEANYWQCNNNCDRAFNNFGTSIGDAEEIWRAYSSCQMGCWLKYEIEKAFC